MLHGPAPPRRHDRDPDRGRRRADGEQPSHWPAYHEMPLGPEAPAPANRGTYPSGLRRVEQQLVIEDLLDRAARRAPPPWGTDNTVTGVRGVVRRPPRVEPQAGPRQPFEPAAPSARGSRPTADVRQDSAIADRQWPSAIHNKHRFPSEPAPGSEHLIARRRRRARRCRAETAARATYSPCSYDAAKPESVIGGEIRSGATSGAANPPAPARAKLSATTRGSSSARRHCQVPSVANSAASASSPPTATTSTRKTCIARSR